MKKLTEREKRIAREAFSIGQRTSACFKNDWEKYIYWLCLIAANRKNSKGK